MATSRHSATWSNRSTYHHSKYLSWIAPSTSIHRTSCTSTAQASAIGSSRRIIKQEKFGYETQKAVKCDWTQWSDADAVLQIDSDMILTAPLEAKQLFKGDHPVWLRRDWSKCHEQQIKYWQLGSRWFYERNESQYSYMTSPGVFLTRELTEKFKKLDSEQIPL